MPLPSSIPDSVFSQIKAHVESEYPQEGCGFVLLNHTKSIWEVVPCRNAQDEMHKEDPVQFPRTAKNGFFVHPEDLLSVHKQATRSSRSQYAFYHSHIDAPPELSCLDREKLIENGEPWNPDLWQLVASVNNGTCSLINIYAWSKGLKDYCQTAQKKFLPESQTK